MHIEAEVCYPRHLHKGRRLCSSMEIPGVDETIRRVCAHRGVMGVIVTTRDGTLVRTTMDAGSTQQYIGGIQSIEEKCSSAVREVDPTNELQYIRIRSNRFEIMLKREPSYLLYVIQNPSGAV